LEIAEKVSLDIGLFTDVDKTLIIVNERVFNYLARYARPNIVPFLHTCIRVQSKTLSRN